MGFIIAGWYVGQYLFTNWYRGYSKRKDAEMEARVQNALDGDGDGDGDAGSLGGDDDGGDDDDDNDDDDVRTVDDGGDGDDDDNDDAGSAAPADR